MLIAPIAGSIAFVHYATRVVGPPTSSLAVYLAWWFGLIVLATLVLFAIDRVSRRLLPLAALLKLSLIFPDEAPSRFKLALDAGSVDTLEKRLALMKEARESASASEAAGRLLELIAALNAHDHLTRGHSERVRAYSVLIGRQLGLSDDEVDLLNWAALLHDVGKLEVPAEILNKNGRPSDEEWAVLRKHPLFGEELAEPMREWLGSWAAAIGYHHEHWDGKGYPRGVSDDEIPLAGRIVAVADVFDVITSVRSYKEAGAATAGRAEIARCAGTQFDPRVVRAFLNVSLGRMRLVMGPFSLLSHLQVLSKMPMTPAMGTIAGAFTVVAGSLAGGLIVKPADAQIHSNPPAIVAAAAPAVTPVAGGGTSTSTKRDSTVIPERRRPRVKEPETTPPTTQAPVHSPAVVAPKNPAATVTAPSAPSSVVPAPSAPATPSGQGGESEATRGDGTLPDQSGESPPAAVDPAPDVTAPPAPTPPAKPAPPAAVAPAKPTTPVTESPAPTVSPPASPAPEVDPPPARPVAVDEHESMLQGGSIAVDVLAAAANPAGQTLSIVSVGPADHGTATVIGDLIRFDAPGDYFGPASFAYTIKGGQNGTSTANVMVDIQHVNQAPAFSSGPDETVLEDASAQSISGWATSITPGPANEASQTVSFVVSNDQSALFSAQPTVGPGGTLAFTAAPNANGTANVTVTALDSGGTANGGVDTSASASFTITIVPVNDPPAFAAGAGRSVLENAGPQSVPSWAGSISSGPSNESGQSVSFTVTNDNNALFAAQPAVAADGTLTFTPATDTSGVATVTVSAVDNGGTANGGLDTSAAQTFTITVAAVNAPPSFTAGAPQTVLEDSGVQSAVGWATSISPGPAGESAQTVTFSVSNDNPGLFSAPPVVASNGTLSYTPAADANGSATVTVRAVDNGGTANGGNDTSAPQTIVVAVTAVNDVPSFVAGGDDTVVLSTFRSIPGWATAISPGPANESGQSVTFVVTNDDPGIFSVQPAVAPDGTLTYTANLLVIGSATVTVRVVDNGGTANGGVDTSAPQTFTISVIL